MKPRSPVTGNHLQIHSCYLRFLSCTHGVRTCRAAEAARRQCTCADTRAPCMISTASIVSGNVRDSQSLAISISLICANRGGAPRGRWWRPLSATPRARPCAAPPAARNIHETTIADDWESPTTPLMLSSVPIMHPPQLCVGHARNVSVVAPLDSSALNPPPTSP
jgi:hypothetical protein